MYKRIFVPLDSTPNSNQIVRWSLAFAKALDSEVTFFHVVEWSVPATYGLPVSPTYLSDFHEDLKAAGHATLEAAKAQAAAAGVTCDAYLHEGEHPAQAIAHTEATYDLTVMATHSRRGLDRLFLGSVTEAVLRRSATPHLLLHHPGEDGGSLPDPKAFKHLLLPIDGSACSDYAFAEGLKLARALGAKVTILHALEVPITVYTMPGSMVYDSHTHDDLRKFAGGLLHRARESAQTEGVEAMISLVDDALVRADQAIIDAESSVDLTVMGTHGRRGFNRLFLGSVTERALRRSMLPHLVIKSPQDDTSDIPKT